MNASTTALERRTAVTASAVAECPFSIAEEYAAGYLQSAEAGREAAYIRVAWFFPLNAFRHRVKLSFGRHLDAGEPGRAHDELRVHWASGTRLLPDFRGTVRFRIDGMRTLVIIEGSYGVPLGNLGRAFDALIGKRVAQASMQDLADRIARYLGKREATWRQAQAS
jgi:hypothetical protein